MGPAIALGPRNGEMGAPWLIRLFLHGAVPSGGCSELRDGRRENGACCAESVLYSLLPGYAYRS